MADQGLMLLNTFTLSLSNGRLGGLQLGFFLFQVAQLLGNRDGLTGNAVLLEQECPVGQSR
jgi:hypothetical protein